MPVTQIDVQEVTPRWKEILTLAETGSDIVITDNNIPKARLVPLTSATSASSRKPGLHLGAIETADDFDAPLEDSFWAGERS
jgi:antitoxin (DNA-binding transcriptional repressor) of toxin-antitoxin stability system